jgi:hypothetical protein
MKGKFAVSVFLISIIGGVFIMSALGQPSLFLWGNVRWNTGSPAVGLEVRLIHVSTRNIVARAYTNQIGRFAFFGIGGQPSDYFLQACIGNTVRGGTGLPALPIGGQAPDIIIN